MGTRSPIFNRMISFSEYILIKYTIIKDFFTKLKYIDSKLSYAILKIGFNIMIVRNICINNMVETFSTTCGSLTNNDKIPNLNFLESLYPDDYRHIFILFRKIGFK